jgi:AcrR family transcriptional regulator
VFLFSDYGYNQVTLKDIAKECGIRAASIYNHYESKAEILREIYALFDNVRSKVEPSLSELLKEAETADPISVIQKAFFYYDPDYQAIMDRIVLIAACEQRTDEMSRDIINKRFIDLPRTYLLPLLNRLIELERIEAFDVEAYVILMENFCYGAALRNFSGNSVTLENWNRANALLETFIHSRVHADKEACMTKRENRPSSC